MRAMLAQWQESFGSRPQLAELHRSGGVCGHLLQGEQLGAGGLQRRRCPASRRFLCAQRAALAAVSAVTSAGARRPAAPRPARGSGVGRLRGRSRRSARRGAAPEPAAAALAGGSAPPGTRPAGQKRAVPHRHGAHVDRAGSFGRVPRHRRGGGGTSDKQPTTRIELFSSTGARICSTMKSW